MIKNVLFAVLQFILFLLIFLVGSLFPPFHLEHILGITPEGKRIFIGDGVFLMTAVFAIILTFGMDSAIARTLQLRMPTEGDQPDAFAGTRALHWSRGIPGIRK